MGDSGREESAETIKTLGRWSGRERVRGCGRTHLRGRVAGGEFTGAAEEDERGGWEGGANGRLGENMGGGGDLTLINGFVGREGDGRDTRLGACLAERCVRWRTDCGDLQRGPSNSSPQHEGRNEAGREPSPPPKRSLLAFVPSPRSQPSSSFPHPPYPLTFPLSSSHPARPVQVHQKPCDEPDSLLLVYIQSLFLPDPDPDPDTLLLTCHI